MNVVEQLKAEGWKPVASSDGEFKPLKGTYECNWVVLRKEHDDKNNADFVQVEIKPVGALEGDAFGEKFSFKKRFYLGLDKEGKDQTAEQIKELGNMVFTAGIDVDLSSATDEDSIIALYQAVIGKPCYVRSWGWTPKDADGARQMWVLQKAQVAEKKRSAASMLF